MDQLTYRNSEVADDRLAEACKDLIVDLAREAWTVKWLNGQRNLELHERVDGRVSTGCLRISLQVLQVGADFGWHETFKVEVDEGFLDRKQTRGLEATHTQDIHRDLKLSHIDGLVQSDVLNLLLEVVVILNDGEADEDLARHGSLGREAHWVPLRLGHGVTFAVSALINGDASPCQEVTVVLANECLVLVVTVNDEGWQVAHRVRLIHHIDGLVVNRVQVIIDNLCALRRVRIDQLQERIRSAV